MKPRAERLEQSLFGCQSALEKCNLRIQRCERHLKDPRGNSGAMARDLTRYRMRAQGLLWNIEKIQKKLKQ